VNAELNRAAHVRKISEATAGDLERRLAKADAWLTHARARRVAG
jgi:hypothetical protein